MIPMIILSVWIALGIANIFLWRKYVDEAADSMAPIFNMQFTWYYFGFFMLLLSPYFFFVYVKTYIQHRREQKKTIKRVLPVLERICEKNGIDMEATMKSGEVVQDEKKGYAYYLYWAWAYCDHHDKSTEFMIQFMQDLAGVDHDTVMDFLQSTQDIDRSRWYERHPDWRSENLENGRENNNS